MMAILLLGKRVLVQGVAAQECAAEKEQEGEV